MKTETIPSPSIDHKSQIDYGKLTVLQLADRISNSGDAKALRELHNNRRFYYREDRRSYRLAEYIATLKSSKIARQWCGRAPLALEEAYDRTIDKFNNLPARAGDNKQKECQGPDCQLYFSAYLAFTTAHLEEKPPANALEAELISLEMLRRMIDRQFYLSCLDARRKEYGFAARRYRWRFDSGDLYIWLPFEVHHCQSWLQANVGEVDPLRRGEKNRVQVIVDRLLARRKLYSLSELCHVERRLLRRPGRPVCLTEEQVSVDGLAQTVADEKAENMERQRRTIQLLGKDKLKELIHTVFARLACGEYVEKDIADFFELSPATFSRFAGSHWKRCSGRTDVEAVPVLWRNVAHTLAGHSKFVMAASKARVLKCVQEILKAEQAKEDLG